MVISEIPKKTMCHVFIVWKDQNNYIPQNLCMKDIQVEELLNRDNLILLSLEDGV